MNKYYVLNEKNNIEYIILEVEVATGIEFSLFRSDSEEWSDHARNELVISAIDTGNGYVFSNKISKTMDYSQAVELLILMTAMSKIDDNLMETYKISKLEEICQV